MNGRKGNGMDLHRTNLHGPDRDRNGVLYCLDRNVNKGGTMREAIIISVILILAVLLWKPWKGGMT